MRIPIISSIFDMISAKREVVFEYKTYAVNGQKRQVLEINRRQNPDYSLEELVKYAQIRGYFPAGEMGEILRFASKKTNSGRMTEMIHLDKNIKDDIISLSADENFFVEKILKDEIKVFEVIDKINNFLNQLKMDMTALRMEISLRAEIKNPSQSKKNQLDFEVTRKLKALVSNANKAIKSIENKLAETIEAIDTKDKVLEHSIQLTGMREETISNIKKIRVFLNVIFPPIKRLFEDLQKNNNHPVNSTDQIQTNIVVPINTFKTTFLSNLNAYQVKVLRGKLKIYGEIARKLGVDTSQISSNAEIVTTR